MQAGARRCLSCCCSDRCHHHCHRCGFSSQSLLALVLCRQQGWSYLVGGGCWVPSTCWSVKGSKCAPRSARPGLHVVVSRWCHLTPFLLCAHMSFFFHFSSFVFFCVYGQIKTNKSSNSCSLLFLPPSPQHHQLTRLSFSHYPKHYPVYIRNNA